MIMSANVCTSAKQKYTVAVDLKNIRQVVNDADFGNFFVMINRDIFAICNGAEMRHEIVVPLHAKIINFVPRLLYTSTE